MTEHCILFGHRGHLAQTRIIPSLVKRGVSFTGVSRRHRVDLSGITDPNVYAYMSIPTHALETTLKPYETEMNQLDPLYILEKPYGLSRSNFMEIDRYIHTRDMNVIFNDHYLGKDAMRYAVSDKWTCPNVADTRSIMVTIHEGAGVDDRLGYFNDAGIVLDMYQNHTLVVYSIILSRIFNCSRKDILKELAKTKINEIILKRYKGYQGDKFTYCKIYTHFRHVTLIASVGKMLPDEKHVDIVTTNGVETLDLSNNMSCPYDNIIGDILKGDHHLFPDVDEIRYMWDHVSDVA